MARQAAAGYSPTSPGLRIEQDDTNPALQIRAQGAGNAIEVIDGSGTPLWSVGAGGSSNGGLSDDTLRGLGLLAWTQDPHQCNSSFAKNTQFIHGSAVWLPKGVTITNLAVFVGVVGAAMTHYFLGLADNAYKVLATSADQPTKVQSLGWQTLALTAPYTTTYSGLHQLLELGVSGTMPSIMGGNLSAGSTAGRGQLPNNGMYWWFDSSSAWNAFPAVGQTIPTPQASSNDHCIVAW